MAAASLAEQLKPLSSEAQEERLLSFLASCGGPEATPAYNVMANQLGILEEGVRVLLGRLENKGRIHFISRNPPRIMLLKPGESPIGPGVSPTPEGAAARFLNAEGERMRLGRFIADCERRLKRGPSLREMQDFVGFGSAGYVNRMAEILAERGLVQYGRGVPTKLTEQGRQFFGLKSEGAKKMEQTKPVIVVPIKPHERKDMRQKALLLCKVLAERCRTDPENGAYTRYDDLSLDMGYAKSSGLVSDAAREAQRLGYIKPKPPKCHGLFFTEKGRAKFMPETIEEGMPYDAPKPTPEITFTDRVPEESPLRKAAEEVFAPAVSVDFNEPKEVTYLGQRPSADALDFDLNSKRLRVTGSTKSRAELAAFIGKLGALMPFLGE